MVFYNCDLIFETTMMKPIINQFKHESIKKLWRIFQWKRYKSHSKVRFNLKKHFHSHPTGFLKDIFKTFRSNISFSSSNAQFYESPNFNFPNLRCCKVFFLYNITSYIGIFGCILTLTLIQNFHLEKILKRKQTKYVFGIRKIGCSMSWM